MTDNLTFCRKHGIILTDLLWAVHNLTAVEKRKSQDSICGKAKLLKVALVYLSADTVWLELWHSFKKQTEHDFVAVK